MKKCLLWGTGKVYVDNIKTIEKYESMNAIEVIAVTSNEYDERDYGYKYIHKSGIDVNDYDFVIVMSKKYIEIEHEAVEMGFSVEQIVPFTALNKSIIELDDYRIIKKKKPTIFSMNCWGGIVYHRFGLEFNSPFINMFVLEHDFIKFLKNPNDYLECEIEQIDEEYNKDLDIYYPVCLCKDIKLYFNHYTSFQEAYECWNRRKQRINWDNIIAVMYTDNYDIAKEFDGLQYRKKICFSSIFTSLKSCVYLPNPNDDKLYKLVNSVAWGNNTQVDVIKLLI